MITLGLEPVRKIRKSDASCAIFGALSFSGKPLEGSLAVRGISEAESARGGAYGNGVMFARTERGQRGKNLCIWAEKDIFVDRIRGILSEEGVRVGPFQGSGQIHIAKTEAEYLPLLAAVFRANSELPPDQARVLSFGHGLTLYKGLESLSDLDKAYGFSQATATGMIAHTRYPTGSQPKVARAHPFSFGNVGIVHNGDVTSFSANLRACESRLAELYHLYSGNGVSRFIENVRKSWVGTDSEVIAAMMYTMLKTGLVSEPGLSIGGIMDALIPAFDNSVTRLLRGSAERARLDSLAVNYKGFGLDGPVSCISLITYEDEVQMLAFRDRNTFRPLHIVIDHEKGNVYAASEQRQIEAAAGVDIFSSAVESYSLEPGKFLWASSRSKVIESGRSRRPFIACPGLRPAGGQADAISGAPHQFAGERIEGHRTYYGTLGSHGGSYTDGEGTFEAVGSLQDNCFEASSVRRVVCHANAGMMLGNAFQGERFFHRGSVDSRAFQQLRPKGEREPVVVIGETAGQYLGKMQSGGTIFVLGLEHLAREDVDTPIVGEFLGTGMVRGKIYVRSYVIDDFIKRPPQRRDVIAVCAQLKEEKLISESALREIRHNPLSLPRIRKILEGSRLSATDPGSVEKAMGRLSPLFDQSLLVERRGLNEAELGSYMPIFEDYRLTFSLPADTPKRLGDSNWTVLSVPEKV